MESRCTHERGRSPAPKDRKSASLTPSISTYASSIDVHKFSKVTFAVLATASLQTQPYQATVISYWTPPRANTSSRVTAGRLSPCPQRRRVISSESLAPSNASMPLPERQAALKDGFINLPPSFCTQLSTMARTLSDHLDVLITSGQLRATDIFPIAKEVLDLSSVCCVMDQRRSRRTMPVRAEIDAHVEQAWFATQRGWSCPCCSAMDLMDLDGEVLHSFPDDGDDGLVSLEVQDAAMRVVEREVAKALKRVDDVFWGGVEKKAAKKKKSMIEGLRGMFGRSSTKMRGQ